MSRTLQNSLGGERKPPRADGDRSISAPFHGAQSSVDPTSDPSTILPQAGLSNHDLAVEHVDFTVRTTLDEPQANVLPASQPLATQQQGRRLAVTRETMVKVVENAIAKAVSNPSTCDSDITKLHNLPEPYRQQGVDKIAQWLQNALRDGSAAHLPGLTVSLEADIAAAGTGPGKEGGVEGGILKLAPRHRTKRPAEKDRVAAGKALAESIVESAGNGELQIKEEYAQEWLSHLWD